LEFIQVDSEKEIGSKRRELVKKYRKMIDSQKERIMDLFGAEDFDSGTWFVKLFDHVLSIQNSHKKSRWLIEKYSKETEDETAEAIISESIAATTTIGLVLGGAGGLAGIKTSIITTPPEIVLTTFNQLTMVIDLSILYGVPFTEQDSRKRVLTLLSVFGISPSEMEKEMMNVSIQKAEFMALELIGRFIVKKFAGRSLSKLIPVIGTVVGAAASATTNYRQTRKLSKRALTCFRAENILKTLYRSIPDISVPCREDRIFKKPGENLLQRVQIAVTMGILYIISGWNNPLAPGETVLSLLRDYSSGDTDPEKMENVTLQDFVLAWQQVSIRSRSRRESITETMLLIFTMVAASNPDMSNRLKQKIKSLAIQLNMDDTEADKKLDKMYKSIHTLTGK
jgi:uncharacterized protein (DUF697 family)